MTKKIELTHGQYALVDDEDFEYLNQFKWDAHWYPHTKSYYATCNHYVMMGNEKKRIMSRMPTMIMNAPKGKVVDHINHDTLDNRKSNLRIVSIRQNNQNKKNKGTSKYPGVSWDKSRQKWRAYITINKKQKHLGRFNEEQEAAKAYEQACRKLVGEELVCKQELPF